MPVFWRLRRSRSRKNTGGRERRGGLVVQCAVDTVVVDVEPPTSFFETQEHFSIEKFVA